MKQCSKLIQLIKAPCITEKSSLLSGVNQWVFKVANSASKPNIAAAVEELFKVKVSAVRTCRMHGKTRRFRGRVGKCSDWKKAYITLVEGQSIDFNNISV